jgi:hypothetical protein
MRFPGAIDSTSYYLTRKVMFYYCKSITNRELADNQRHISFNSNILYGRISNSLLNIFFSAWLVSCYAWMDVSISSENISRRSEPLPTIRYQISMNRLFVHNPCKKYRAGKSCDDHVIKLY